MAETPPPIPLMPPTPLVLTQSQLTDLLEAASERGAKRALAQVGLGDEDAHKDLLELRSLVDAYRVIKHSMIATFAKAIALGVIAAITAYFWFKH